VDEDHELLARFRAGERKAFDELVRRHERPIFLLALRYLTNVEDARDVAQRAFVQAYQQLGAFRGDASFRTWVYRIAANLSLDALRKRGRDARLQLEAAENGAPEDLRRERDRLERLEERERLRGAVAALPPK
jgi:RNA polymerase sigma-70 factor (ECF subfamily)